MPYSVPRAWPGETCAILASGPSMSRDVCERIRGRCRTIAVSNQGIPTRDSITGVVHAALAPWADVLYSSDAKWWNAHRAEAMKFAGLKIGGAQVPHWEGLHHLAFSPKAPFDERPTHLVTGANSGYQAVHLAAHFGASRILLFGFDMRVVGQRQHWFGNHPVPLNTRCRFSGWIVNFARLAPALAKRGIELVNCTPGSALRGMKVSTLEREFPLRSALESGIVDAVMA
jgi:hypothetical protein